MSEKERLIKEAKELLTKNEVDISKIRFNYSKKHNDVSVLLHKYEREPLRISIFKDPTSPTGFSRGRRPVITKMKAFYGGDWDKDLFLNEVKNTYKK